MTIKARSQGRLCAKSWYRSVNGGTFDRCGGKERSHKQLNPVQPGYVLMEVANLISVPRTKFILSEDRMLRLSSNRWLCRLYIPTVDICRNSSHDAYNGKAVSAYHLSSSVI